MVASVQRPHPTDNPLGANLTWCRAELRLLRAKTHAPAPPPVFCAPQATINDTEVFDFKSRSLSLDAPEYVPQASRRPTFSKSEISVGEGKMKMKASNTRFLSKVWLGALGFSLCGGIAWAGGEPDEDKDNKRSTAEDFLRLGGRPLSTWHHGVWPNPGENPALPNQNTVGSAPQGVRPGARAGGVGAPLT